MKITWNVTHPYKAAAKMHHDKICKMTISIQKKLIYLSLILILSIHHFRIYRTFRKIFQTNELCTMNLFIMIHTYSKKIFSFSDLNIQIND